jgi:glycosyltransferase involved in cell wall biosynthesis
MRIAFVAHVVPNVEHSTVTYSAFLFLKALREAGHAVSAVLLLPELGQIDGQQKATYERWLRELAQIDIPIHILPDNPEVADRHRILRRIRSLFWPRVEDFFPWVLAAGKVGDTLVPLRADVIFIFASYSGVAATRRTALAPRFAFVGDPLHLPGLYRQYPPFAPRRSRLSPYVLLYKLYAFQQARMMIRLLAECDGVAGNAAHHVEWLRRNGVPQCKYLPNMVPDLGGTDWQSRRKQCSSGMKFKMLLFGNLHGTATLSGLYFLADEVLPSLEKTLGDSFQIHICGKGTLPPDLAPKLNRPSVIMRGFVDDLAAELMTAHIFLMPTPIPLGSRVRIPYVWSTGCPVIAHEANRMGLPEMLDEKNALLARNGKSLARAIIRAYHDPDLRIQLGIEGRRTYESYFSYEVTSSKMLAELTRVAQMNSDRSVSA